MFNIRGILLLLIVTVVFAGCNSADEELFSYNKSFEDIAKWNSMVTPGGGEGSVTKGDGVAIIHAAADGWGGVQSEMITIDSAKNQLLFVQVNESVDGVKWGAKFTPATPEVDGHAWGFYLIEDNNFKWNNYAVADINFKLGEEFFDVYGDQVEGYLWIYSAGSPEAEVEITSVKILDQK